MPTRMSIGTEVDDFTLPDQDGNPRKLSEFLADGPVVLFFYPAAMTKGCTAESCHFRDLGDQFVKVGAQRVGISRDPVDKQRRFAEQNEFDFPLLSDVDGAVARRFGVRRTVAFGPLVTKRATFVIDTDRRVVGTRFNELNMNSHADFALKMLRDRAAGGRPNTD